jgi:hypothetical protein
MGWDAVYVQTMHDNAAANPDHGGSAHRTEKCEENGHTENKGTPGCTAHSANR